MKVEMSNKTETDLQHQIVEWKLIHSEKSGTAGGHPLDRPLLPSKAISSRKHDYIFFSKRVPANQLDTHAPSAPRPPTIVTAQEEYV